jgi:hypothetical protein
MGERAVVTDIATELCERDKYLPRVRHDTAVSSIAPGSRHLHQAAEIAVLGKGQSLIVGEHVPGERSTSASFMRRHLAARAHEAHCIRRER